MNFGLSIHMTKLTGNSNSPFDLQNQLICLKFIRGFFTCLNENGQVYDETKYAWCRLNTHTSYPIGIRGVPC